MTPVNPPAKTGGKHWWLGGLDDRYDVLIVANGTPPPRDLFELVRRRCRQLIALDGGLNVLRRWNIAPKRIIGDLDSATRPALEWAKEHRAVIHARPSQDRPDIEKCFDVCRQAHLRSALIAAIDGDALDHVLNSLSAASNLNLRVSFVTASVVVHVLRGKMQRSWKVPEKHKISWLGWPKADDCTLQGVVWPFEHRSLVMGKFNSLSNLPRERMVSLRQEAGVSLLFLSLRPKWRQGLILSD